MDLRGIANSVSSTVNPNIPITVRASDGYSIGTGRKQVPAYLPDVNGYGQLQALDGDDLKQLEGLNIQGTIKALYVTGTLAGVIRPNEKGGDIIIIDGQEWLTVKVIEGWANWTKVAIRLQGAA